MKKTLLSLGLLLIAGASVAQVQFSTLPDAQQNYDASEHGWCGFDESRLELMQEHSMSQQVFTTGLTYRNASQSTYFEDCGAHFRVYYDDFNYSQLDGFALVAGGVGAQRRNTMCAVLQYIESVVDFTGINDRIEIFVARSYSPTNLAPIGTQFLGQASPYYNNPGYISNTPGFYGGNIYDHVQNGTDPYPNFYDGWTQMNFDAVASGPVSYWDDYTNTTATCRYDLYSILLHEITHAMGWLSRVQESASTNNPTMNTNGRRFSILDQNYLYYGNIQTASFTKLVNNSTIDIEPLVNNNPYPVRSNKVWMNAQGTPNNHPAYSGDFYGYSAIPPAPFAIASLLSHMSFGYNSFISMSQYSPGYRDSYVMGPAIAKEMIKRVYTYFEMRTLDNIGYNYNPTFATSTSLNGVEQNQTLLNTNHTPAKTNQWQSTEYAVWSITTLSFGECMTADATIALNDNTTTNPNTTSVVINVSSLGTDVDGDVVKAYSVGGVPEIFNIRGCGDGNNHNQLVVNGAGTTITYTPRVGFKGRAQFGMFLTDGREKGAFRVVTIDVNGFGPAFLSSLPTAPELVMNGSNEQGTEVRQRVINESINNTGIEYNFLEGLFMAGGNFTDGRPTYDLHANNWTSGGGSILHNTYNGCSFINNGRKGAYGHANIDWNTDGYNGPWSSRPTPNTVTNPNERYCQFISNINYIPLILPAQTCHVYRIEFDVNMQRTTNVTIGQQYTINVQFTGNPGCALPSVLYTVPVTFTVTTLSPNVWQHVSQDIYYCGPSSSWMNFTIPLLHLAYRAPLFDNISLHEISVPPLAVTASASPTTICSGNPTTLTAVATNTMCTTTYTWQPGNLNGASVVVNPTATTTYTVTVNDGCSIQTATVLVTVQPGNSPTTWPKFLSGASSRSVFNGVVSDGQGNVYATGYISGATTIPSFGTINAVNKELIVVKYNEQCGGVWIRTVTGGNVVGYDITLDNSGNVLVVGSVSGTNINFGNSQILTTSTGTEGFLLKLNSTTGNTIFARQTTSPVLTTLSQAITKAIKYDPVNNAIYVTGDFQGVVKFGTLANITTAGGRDVFVTRYSSAGTEVWSKQIASASSDDIAGGIGTSSTGVVYVGCSVANSVTIPISVTNSGTGTHDLFIINFVAATGAYGGNNLICGNSTAGVFLKDLFVDATGRCYFTGQYKGSLTLGSVLPTATTQDIFVGFASSTLSLAGAWAYSAGSANAASTLESGNSIWVYNNDVYFAGTAYNGATFSGFTPSTFTSTAGHEVFVARVLNGGTRNFLETSISTVGAAQNIGFGITVSPTSGSIFTCGGLGITAGPLPNVTFNPPALQPLTSQQGFIARSNSSAFFRLGNPELNVDETQADNTLAEQTLMSTSPDLTFNAYPNPTDGILHIVLPSNQQSVVGVSVMDISGRTVKSEMMKPNDQGQLTIDLSGLEEGIYLITTNNNGQVNTGRIVLRH